MTGPTIGSLFTGYGGLDLAVEDVLNARTVWTCDIDPAAARILRRRFPHAPNLGDITAADWSTVPSVDVITGGFPCQDVSHAGARKGLSPGTRSGLWSRMANAINQLHPALVIAENVRGLLSAAADSDVEPCPWCMGGAGDGEPALRALGSVLADLAELGYDAAWHGLRAADVGAPHGRFRVFVLAWPADPEGIGRRREWVPGQGHGAAADGGWPAPSRGRASATANPDGVGQERAGCASAWRRSGSADDAGPRPHAPVSGAAAPDTRRERVQRRADGRGVAGEERPGAGEGLHRQRRGDTPRDGRAATPDADGDGLEGIGRVDTIGRDVDGRGRPDIAWGDYEPAIRRWERTLGRPAPAPTEPGSKGQPRLSPVFVEWMMGLPEGWVTTVPGLSRNDQLKALGNGVVPQHAVAALRTLIAWRTAALSDSVLRGA